MQATKPPVNHTHMYTHTHSHTLTHTHTHIHVHTHTLTHTHTHTVAETNYQTFLQKKQLLETAYQNLEAELNGLIREAEKQTSLSLTAHEAERQAEEMAETLPDKINELKEKIENIGKLIFSENREM